MLLLNLDHVALAVADLEAALKRFLDLYGVAPAGREVVADQGVEEAMLLVGGSRVQLVAPLGPDTPVGRFLARHGEGLHHLAFAVPDIEAALAHLEAQGAELIDRVPRRGGDGARVESVQAPGLAVPGEESAASASSSAREAMAARMAATSAEPAPRPSPGLVMGSPPTQ